MEVSKALSIIVLHYGDAALTRECIRSLSGADAWVYVVDNSPGSLSAEDVQAGDVAPEIVVTGSNLGYAGGMNAGIRKAMGDGARRLAVLNNDTIAEPGFVEKVISRFAEPKNGRTIFSPLILDGEGKKVWFGGGKISWLAARAKHSGFGSGSFPGSELASGFLTGCAICFPKEAAEEAGLMREDYFLYWEDIDWSVRLIKKGWALSVFPEIRIRHLGSAAAGLESDGYIYYYHRNQLLFLLRNCPPFLLPFSLAGLTLNLARIFTAWLFLHGKEGRRKVSMTIKGIYDSILGRRGPARVTG